MPASSNLVAGQIAAAIANAEAYEEERRRAEALAEIDRAKTAFFSNVSHEFRTPLTLMLGPLEEVLGQAGRRACAGEARALVSVAHRNGVRLLKLVNSLLDFSRIEAGRAQASFEPVDLAGFTAELASTFRSAIERAGLRLRIDCPPLAEPVYVDRDMWEKIVLNLLSNAFKFTFEGESRSRCGRRPTASRPRSRCATPAPAFRPESCRACSSASIASRARAAAASKAAASAWRWCRSWSGCTAARSPSTSEVGVGSSFTVRLPFGADHLPADRVQAGTRERTRPACARRPMCRRLRLARRTPGRTGQPRRRRARRTCPGSRRAGRPA